MSATTNRRSLWLLKPPTRNGNSVTVEAMPYPDVAGVVQANPSQPQLSPTSTPSPEPPRRIVTHNYKSMKTAQVVAIICAVNAGIGNCLGMIDPEAGISGYLVPVGMSIAIGAVLAALWHFTLLGAARVREPLAYIGVGVTTVAAVAIGVSSSSWSVATVLSGHAALRSYQHDIAVRFDHAEDAAWKEAAKEYGVILATHAAALSWHALATDQLEFGAGLGAGRGPVEAAFSAAAKKFDEQEQRLTDTWDTARHLHIRAGELKRAEFNTIGRDPTAFSDATNELRNIISAENDLHLTGMVVNGGLVNVNTLTANKAVIARLEQTIAATTATLNDSVKRIANNRIEVPAPDYLPLNERDSVKLYWETTALSGWIAAISIDAAPAISVLFLLLYANSRNMNEPDDTRRPEFHPDTGKPQTQPH